MGLSSRDFTIWSKHSFVLPEPARPRTSCRPILSPSFESGNYTIRYENPNPCRAQPGLHRPVR